MVTPRSIDGGRFFWVTLRDSALTILVVHCDDPGKDCFRNANCWLLEASGCKNVRQDVTSWRQRDDMRTDTVLELETPIVGLNLEALWIDIAEYEDVMGIGIGSNMNKRERAAWLALALSFDLTGKALKNKQLFEYYQLVRKEYLDLERVYGRCPFLPITDGPKRRNRLRSSSQRSRSRSRHVPSRTQGAGKPSKPPESEWTPSQWTPLTEALAREIRDENKEPIHKNSAYVFLKECKDEILCSTNAAESRDGMCVVKRITTYDFPWTSFIAALSDSKLRANVIGLGIANVSVCLEYAILKAPTKAIPYFLLHYVDETHASLHVQMDEETLHVHWYPIKHLKHHPSVFLPCITEVCAAVKNVCEEYGNECDRPDWIHKSSYFSDEFVKRHGLLTIQLNMQPSLAANPYTLSQEYVRRLRDFMNGEKFWSKSKYK